MESNEQRSVRWFYYGMTKEERKSYLRWKAWKVLVDNHPEYSKVMPVNLLDGGTVKVTKQDK